MKKTDTPWYAYFWLAVGVALMGGGFAWAHSGSPSAVVWSDGQALTATDLNNTVAHLHNTLTGGVADSNISTTAAISHSKLAFPALVPKAWASLNAACDGAAAADTACVVTAWASVTGVASRGAGVGKYWVNFSFTPADPNFAVFLTARGSDTFCAVTSIAGTANHAIGVDCSDRATGPINAAFNVMVMDN